MEIGEFGVGRPDFGGRWPRGEALGQIKNKKILRGEKNVPLRGHFVARKKAFKLYGVGQEEGGRGGVDFGAFG